MALSNDHSVRKYAYEALQSSRHIRLIILHSASSTDAPLKFTFQQAKLSELEGCYEAISYTWGQPNLTYPLHVSDGTHVLVTENLDRALRYLRRSHKDRALWADAACINQADDVEKSVQIPLMAQIFQNAGTVLAWLDPGSAASRSHDLESTLKSMENASRKRRRDILPGGSWMIETNGKEDYASPSKLFSEVSKLLRLPWFTRRWIVQEVVFNPEVLLIYGNVELSWARFVVAISILLALRDPEATGSDSKLWSAVKKIALLWRYHSLFEQSSDNKRESHDTDIVKLLDDFDQNECTDPRDRVYALYNMASNLRPSTATSHQHDILIDIDYSLNLQQTYEAFAFACIRAGKLNTIIEAVLSRQHSARPQGWASWVPDWRASWLEPVVLSESVRSIWPLKPEERPPGVIGVKLTTWSYLLDVRYKAYPIILEKAVGDTWPEQCSNLCTKFTRTNAAEDLSALCDMLRYMVQQCYGPTALGALLEQELQCTRSKAYATVSQHDTDLHLMNLAALQSMLNMMIGPRKNMFLFEIPGAERRSVGYGNAHFEVGDQLVPLFETKSARKSSLGAQVVKMVLIVRCAGTTNTKPSPETIYRLVGSGYVYDTAAIEDYDSYLFDKDYSSYERHKTFSNGSQRLYLA
ncbi:hypothetical protein AA0117_g3856 [Alternaria alternata]|uniref:Heterokaryon incompatibility domain-containing protein n=1 Tax=Alternaria alternata TaxID=5599 RepID=A0A4Q4NN63_ALTAL|nr:hypothetical protein AA0117_g3856 [Alternaria alternata]